MGHSALAAGRDLAPLIAQHADEAERERRLARPVADALVNVGLFRLLVPQALGGAGASPLEFCEVMLAEHLAQRIQRATSWMDIVLGLKASTPNFSLQRPGPRTARPRR